MAGQLGRHRSEIARLGYQKDLATAYAIKKPGKEMASVRSPRTESPKPASATVKPPKLDMQSFSEFPPLYIQAAFGYCSLAPESLLLVALRSRQLRD
jgi:hypothetical protein